MVIPRLSATSFIPIIAALFGTLIPIAIYYNLPNEQSPIVLKVAVDDVIDVDFPLPENDLRDSEGQAYHSNIRTGYVLLFSMLTTCESCHRQLEEITTAKLEQSSKFRIFAFCPEDDLTIRRFEKTAQFTVPILRDTDQRLHRVLRISSYPTNYLLKDGIVIKIWIGEPKNSSDLIRKLGIPIE